MCNVPVLLEGISLDDYVYLWMNILRLTLSVYVCVCPWWDRSRSPTMFNILLVYKALYILYIHLQFPLDKCHFLVDLDLSEATPLQPRYSRDTAQWETLVKRPFLDTKRFDVCLCVWMYVTVILMVT